MALRINRSLTALSNQISNQVSNPTQPDQAVQQHESIRYKHQYPIQDQHQDFTAIHYAPPETLDPYAAALEPSRSLPVLEIVSHLQPNTQSTEPELDIPKQPELSEIIPTIRLSDLEDVSYPNLWNAEDFPMEQPYIGNPVSQYALYSPQHTSQLSLPLNVPETAKPLATRIHTTSNKTRLVARKPRQQVHQSGQSAA